MIILYLKSGCSYCTRVQHVLSDLGISYESRDIANEEHRKALTESGGKIQVPYLVDTDTGTALYESEEIAVYLLANYTSK
jgi:glutaredoxin